MKAVIDAQGEEHFFESNYVSFIEKVNKVLWCCHTFALDNWMKFYTNKYFEDTKLGATEKLYLYINIAVYKYSKLDVPLLNSSTILDMRLWGR